MSHPFGTGLAVCPMCREEVQADLIMDYSGLCCDCDPENQKDCKADAIMDRDGDV